MAGGRGRRAPADDASAELPPIQGGIGGEGDERRLLDPAGWRQHGWTGEMVAPGHRNPLERESIADGVDDHECRHVASPRPTAADPIPPRLRCSSPCELATLAPTPTPMLRHLDRVRREVVVGGGRAPRRRVAPCRHPPKRSKITAAGTMGTRGPPRSDRPRPSALEASHHPVGGGETEGRPSGEDEGLDHPGPACPGRAVPSPGSRGRRHAPRRRRRSARERRSR